MQGIEINQGNWESKSCDIFISVLGYETRCTYVASLLKSSGVKVPKRYAIRFNSRQELAFDENRKWFQSKGFTELDFRGVGFRAVISEVIVDLGSPSECLNVLVDISCMSRILIAEVLLGLSASAVGHRVDVQFLYAPAKFFAPNQSNPLITSSEPVLPEFAGWSFPDLPTHAILGLGFEYDRAIGSLELLDPALAWAFMPVGENPEFESEIRQANRNLEEFIVGNTISEYRLDQPLDLFLQLHSMVSGLVHDSRVVIVPLGPKLFALVAYLVSLVLNASVSVWRVSGEQADIATDSIPSGKVICLNATFR